MSAEVTLTEVTGQQKLNAVMHSPFEVLVNQNYRLFFGCDFGSGSNQYWLEPDASLKNGSLIVDYFNILHHRVSNLLVRSPNSESFRNDIANLFKYMDEIHMMFAAGKIDRKGQSLSVSNDKIFGDICYLKSRATVLESNLHAPNFGHLAKDLKKHYEKVIKPKYS